MFQRKDLRFINDSVAANETQTKLIDSFSDNSGGCANNFFNEADSSRARSSRDNQLHLDSEKPM